MTKRFRIRWGMNYFVPSGMSAEWCWILIDQKRAEEGKLAETPCHNWEMARLTMNERLRREV